MFKLITAPLALVAFGVIFISALDCKLLTTVLNSALTKRVGNILFCQIEFFLVIFTHNAGRDFSDANNSLFASGMGQSNAGFVTCGFCRFKNSIGKLFRQMRFVTCIIL